MYEWSLDALRAARCSPIFLGAALGGGQESREVEVLEGCNSVEDAVVQALPAITSPTVVIHDIAWPFATAELIRRVAAAGAGGAATAAIPLDETLKLSRETFVDKTVDRSGLWRLQWPQAYRTDVLTGALRGARKDWVSLIELVHGRGMRPAVVLGTRANARVGSAEDLEVAEAMAATAEAEAVRGR